MQDGNVSRSLFEGYLQAFEGQTYRWAAAKLGMKEDSLRTLLAIMSLNAMSPCRAVNGILVGDLKKHILNNLPRLRHMLYASNDAFCARVHREIKEQYGFDVEPLFCATSVALKEPRFAYEFDCITDEPVAVMHCMWLNLGKPLNLRPDVCSKLTYSANREELRQFVMTSQEPDLSRYQIAG